jgi:hypothetical protein
MPGTVSDSYDPEFGTAANGDEICSAIQSVYDKLSNILGQNPPVFILDLVQEKHERTRNITASLTEREWRILRFTCERAKDSI